MSLQTGLKTEARILDFFASKDIPVLQPFGNNHSDYDLVIHFFGNFLRIQCKGGISGDDGLFVFHATDNKSRRYVGRADFIAAYDWRTERLFLVRPENIRMNGYIRLQPTKNKQRKNVLFAEDCEARKVLFDLSPKFIYHGTDDPDPLPPIGQP